MRCRSPGKAAAAPPSPAPALVSDADKPGYALPEDPDAFAIVVGVEEYSELPKALGVPERSLILLSGAKAGRSALAKYLESWLPRNANERSKVFFYFSGHGAPDPSTGRAFLMPWDGDPSFLADTAYPVDRLYKTLDGLKAKEVVAMLDACFSWAGGRSVLSEGARYLKPKVQDEARRQNRDQTSSLSGPEGVVLRAK